VTLPDPSSMKFCRPCREKDGRLKATYKIVNGVPLCGGCVADRGGENSTQAKVPIQLEVKHVGKRIDEATAEAVKKDLAGGMSINEAAVKHALSWPTVKRISGGAAKTPKKTTRRQGKTSHGVMFLHHENKKEKGASVEGMLASLRSKRELLDRAIAALESLAE
jgi:hypothetical protein